MTTGAILDTLRAKGVRLTRDGDDLMAAPREALTDDLRALIREHKAELLDMLQPEATDAERRLLTILEANPKLRLAMLEGPETDLGALTFTLAIRGKGTCEVLIPQGRYDPFRLLELLELHGGGKVAP